MAKYRVQGPDGKVHVFEGPDGASPSDVESFAAQTFGGKQATSAPVETTLAQDVVQQGKNAIGGLIRGAGSIGATFARPFESAQENEDRRNRIDTNMADLVGADPNSLLYKGGKIGGEIAGTAGAGGLVGNGLRAIPVIAKAAPAMIDAIGSGGFAGGGNMLTRVAGGAVNGAATAGLVNPNEAAGGAVVGGSLPYVVKVAGAAGNSLYDAASNVATTQAKKLMQSALKPTIAQLKSGDAEIAVQTLLDHGISPTKAGVEKLKSMIDDLNGQISDSIASSGATVSRNKIMQALGDIKAKFTNQVSPTGDLNAIDSVANDFSSHPAFSGYAPAVEAAQNALAKAASEKQTALQAAGKLQTFAAQQKSLAHGDTMRLSVNQPEGQLYYNTGGLGRDATSPSSLPVPGYPRIPGRYTHNIDRVPEGEAGAKEAMSMYAAKRLEEENAAKALSSIQEQGATMPVQQAQQMKQGTYQILSKKYGQVGSAETEAQKALARGLKEEIASAVPGVQALNEQESALIRTLGVAERRSLMDLNKNPVGLTALAHNPIAAAGFLADRSAAFKSIAARMINSAMPAAGSAGQKLLKSANNPLIRASGLATTEASP